MYRLYGKFASYLRRFLYKSRLIFPRINGPNCVARKKTIITEKTKPQTATVAVTSFCFLKQTLFAWSKLNFDWSVHNKHSWTILVVHGFSSFLTATYLTLTQSKTSWPVHQICARNLFTMFNSRSLLLISFVTLPAAKASIRICTSASHQISISRWR